MNDCWNKIGVRGDASCPELQRYIHCRNCPVHSAAASVILDGEPPAGYLAAWTSQVAEPKKLGESHTDSVVIFRIGAEWLALPSTVFREVAASRPAHSLPHRRGGVLTGLVNVRGQLLVCVSLGILLGLDAPAAGSEASQNGSHRLLVMSRDGLGMAVPVDEVHGVHRFHRSELKKTPETVSKAPATYSKAMLPWRGKTVGCLDDELLFYSLTRSLA